MEDFRESARKSNIVSTLVIGGTFGIFLTFGNAWSDFLKEAIVSFMPNHDNEVVQSLIYALSSSFFCVLILFLLIRFDIYMSRIKVYPPRFAFNNRMTNIKDTFNNRVKEVEDVKIKNVVEERKKKQKRKSRESLGKR
tara:strand:- start:438 stop:851 length:414 start_codon:yes stop_codon:yes gene_type:complete